jgi:hypothetical protein
MLLRHIILCWSCLSILNPDSLPAREYEANIEQESGEGVLLVLFENQCLMIKAEEIALNELLIAVADQTGITVTTYMPLNQSVSVDIECYPIDEAIEYLLRDYSFVYAESSTSRLWILPQDDIEFAVMERDAWKRPLEANEADTPLLLQTVSENLNEREDALIDLGRSDQGDALEPLVVAVTDPEQSVREAAILSLSELAGPEAIDALTLAMTDQNPRIREEVIDALGEIGGNRAISLLKQALADEVPFVRHAAAEVLEQIREY